MRKEIYEKSKGSEQGARALVSVKSSHRNTVSVIDATVNAAALQMSPTSVSKHPAHCRTPEEAPHAMNRVWRFLYRAFGTALAIAIMELLATYAQEPIWRVPFVTSIVLVTALPYSEASRPYSVIAGHMSSCVAGFVAVVILGPGSFASALGVGLASLAMSMLRAPHPPAGIDAFLIAANGLAGRWILSPVLIGCLLLVMFSQSWLVGERAIFGDDVF
jgi:CBS-domain-containing membrane protein